MSSKSLWRGLPEATEVGERLGQSAHAIVVEPEEDSTQLVCASAFEGATLE
jgi:hypothetical protein